MRALAFFCKKQGLYIYNILQQMIFSYNIQNYHINIHNNQHFLGKRQKKKRQAAVHAEWRS